MQSRAPFRHALFARYDSLALRSTPAHTVRLHTLGPTGENQRVAWEALLGWCHTGMGDGRSSLLRPWRPKPPPQPLTVAWLSGERGTGKSHLTEALSRSLSRDGELDHIASRRSRMALRLGVKLRESLWWLPRADDQAWDCGYLVDAPAARAALPLFRPRRPTLMILDEPGDAHLAACLQALTAQAGCYRQPVRLLVVAARPAGELLAEAQAMGADGAVPAWAAPLAALGGVRAVTLSGARGG